MATRDGSPFDCANCTERDKRVRNCFNRLGLSEEARAVSGYTEEVIEEHGGKGAQKVFSVGGIRLYECPLSYITDETSRLMRMVFLIDGTGHLPFSGGWADQPYWLVEAFEVYKIESARALKEKG